jgi:biotin transport system substrate-specific component
LCIRGNFAAKEALAKERRYNIKRKNTIYQYLLCAFFAALTAVLSQIMVPLPFTPVPINLAYLAVLLCGSVLGAKNGAIAMFVYILLGAAGAPVFAGLQSGLGYMAGPTGGYIIGYLPMAVVMGLLTGRSMARGIDKGAEAGIESAGDRGKKTLKSIGLTIAKGVPALAVGYAFGTVWFMISMERGLLESLLMCVVPFIPGDMLKVIGAAAVFEALRKPMRLFVRQSAAR